MDRQRSRIKTLTNYMDTIASFPEFGIVKLPKLVTDAPRYIDVKTLKNVDGMRRLACIYSVTETDIIRRWIYIYSEKFQNNGATTTINTHSMVDVMLAIVKYRKSDSVLRTDVHKSIANDMATFLERYKEAALQRNQPDYYIRKLFHDQFDIEMPKEYTLSHLNKMIRDNFYYK